LQTQQASSPESSLEIHDGFNSELVTIASNHTYGNRTVALASPSPYSHATGVSISALPPAVKEAAILVTTAMLKVRGDSSMTMAISSTAGQSVAGKDKMGEDIALAKELLIPYRRVRYGSRSQRSPRCYRYLHRSP
jgi:hypothetical protein